MGATSKKQPLYGQLVDSLREKIETEYEPSEERDLILNFIKSSSRGIVRGSIDE